MIKVNSEDKNIVKIAKQSGINIPAPYYYSNRKDGCCSACLVEINGKKQFACATKPTDDIKIIVDIAYLIILKGIKKRIQNLNLQMLNYGRSFIFNLFNFKNPIQN